MAEIVALTLLILGCMLFVTLIGLMVRDIIRLHEKHRLRQQHERNLEEIEEWDRHRFRSPPTDY